MYSRFGKASKRGWDGEFRSRNPEIRKGSTKKQITRTNEAKSSKSEEEETNNKIQEPNKTCLPVGKSEA